MRVATVAGMAHRRTGVGSDGRGVRGAGATRRGRHRHRDADDVEVVPGEAGAVSGQEHDHGPVPEVDAVGDAAEPDQRAGLERAAARVRGALEREQDRGEHEAEEGVAAAEEARGTAVAADPDAATTRARRRRAREGAAWDAAARSGRSASEDGERAADEDGVAGGRRCA